MDDVEKQLRREVAKLRAGRERVESLIRQAREEPDPVPYATLAEITGWTREFLRRIVNGETTPTKPRRVPPSK